LVINRSSICKRIRRKPHIIGRYFGRKDNELEGASKVAVLASRYTKNPVLYSFRELMKKSQ